LFAWEELSYDQTAAADGHRALATQPGRTRLAGLTGQIAGTGAWASVTNTSPRHDK
jgi:hypothetical protein